MHTHSLFDRDAPTHAEQSNGHEEEHSTFLHTDDSTEMDTSYPRSRTSEECERGGLHRLSGGSTSSGTRITSSVFGVTGPMDSTEHDSDNSANISLDDSSKHAWIIPENIARRHLKPPVGWSFPEWKRQAEYTLASLQSKDHSPEHSTTGASDPEDVELARVSPSDITSSSESQSTPLYSACSTATSATDDSSVTGGLPSTPPPYEGRESSPSVDLDNPLYRADSPSYLCSRPKDTTRPEEAAASTATSGHPLLTPRMLETLREMGLGGIERVINPASGLKPDLSANVARDLKKAWNAFHADHEASALPLTSHEKVYKIPAREKTADDAASHEDRQRFAETHPIAWERAKAFAEKEVQLKRWMMHSEHALADPMLEKWFDTPHPYFNALTKEDLNPPTQRRKVTAQYAKDLDNKYGVKGFVRPEWTKMECDYCKKKGHLQKACPDRVQVLRCESSKIHKFVRWLKNQTFPKLSKNMRPELEALCDLPLELEALHRRAAAFKRKWTRDTGLSPDIFTDIELALYPQYRRGAIWYWMSIPGVNRSFLVDMVQGYRTKMPKLPEPVEFEEQKLSDEDQAIYELEVLRLRVAGVLIPVPENMVRYVHSTFIVHGKKPRTVVNAAPQNHYIPKHKFRLHSNHEILMDVPKGYWTFSWDVQDAFYTAYQHPREALWNCIAITLDGVRLYFGFAGRPMGKNDAPFDYCRGQNILEKYLNSLYIRIKMYMDDQLGYTPPDLMLYRLVVNFVKTLLNLLNINCKLSKTHFRAGVTVQPFVGLVVDTETMRVSLTERKINKLILLGKTTIERHVASTLTIKQVASWFGTFRSCEPAVTQTVVLSLATKALLKECHEKHDLTKPHNWFKKVSLTPGSLTEIHWITENLREICSNAIWYADWDLDIYTDTSETHAAAHSKAGIVHTEFNQVVAKESSLLRETATILLSLVNMQHAIKGKRV